MKRIKSKLFNAETITNRVELSKIYGGAAANKSDVNYVDTKLETGPYDIAVLSVLDIEETKTSLDKPATTASTTTTQSTDV